MVAPSALLSIQDGSGAIQNQGQGYIQELTPGDSVTFRLQSTGGFVPGMHWTLLFESPDTPNLNGLEFAWDPATPTPAFNFTLPPGGFTARYWTSAVDSQNVLSQFTGEIIGNGQGLTITPAGLKGQAPVANGDGTYSPVGHRDYCNVLSFSGVDPTGATDSRAGLQAAINYACANKLILYVPYGTYNYHGVLYFPSALSIEGPGVLTGQNQQPTLQTLAYIQPVGSAYFWGGTWMGPGFRVIPTSTNTPATYASGGGIYRLQLGNIAGGNSYPLVYLSETPASSLNGLTAMTAEYVVNYRESVSLVNATPYCGGCLTDSGPYSEAFKVYCFNSGSTFGLKAAISTLVPPSNVSNVTFSAGVYTVTAAAHGLSTGQIITIAGVAFTGTAQSPNLPGLVVTHIDANTFSITLPLSSGTFSYTSGGTVTNTFVGKQYVVSTGGSDLAINTDYSIAVIYNGSTLQLLIGAPGAAPTYTYSVAASGTITQAFWEDFIIGASNSAGGCNYPLGYGARTNKMEFGNFRLSNTARTITTMRGTEFSAADRDSNTNLLMSFAPAYRGDVIGDNGAVIATCYDPARSGFSATGPGNVFIPIRGVYSIFAAFGPSVSFHRLKFLGLEAISVEVSLGVSTYDCEFDNHKGITRYDNCYDCLDINPSFNITSNATGNASHSWGAAFSVNSGGIITNPNFGSNSGGNFGMVFYNSGSYVRDLFINTVVGPVGLFVNSCLDSHFENVVVANEGGPANGLYCLAVFNHNTGLNWDGGGPFSETIAIAGCNVLIDAGNGGLASQLYRFNFDPAAATTGGLPDIQAHFKCPAGAAPVIPILIDNPQQGRGTQSPFAWSDGSAPVMIRPLELSGRTTWNAAGSGAIACMWGGNGLGTTTGPDFSARTIVITDTGSVLTGTTAIVAPTVAAGYRRRILNSTNSPGAGHSVTFGGATGATVTIAAGKTAEVESNGSGWERVTPDT